jgi:hypothetical protein
MTTVREVLFGAPGDEAAAISTAEGTLRIKNVNAAPVLLAQVGRQLEFEVGEVLVQAWKARSALADAARQTLAEPGTVRRVKLAVYGLPWEYEMDFEIRLSGKRIATVTVQVSLDLEVTALNATVQRGRLVTVDGGQYKVGATLSIHQVPLLARERTFSLPYELKTGDGIALI